jgi:hypothetical protein
MKKYDKQDHILLAIWAADCAERVLPLFENVYPADDRPRKAIKECRNWVRTGVFKMAVIRGTSLAAHTAAREAKENDVACFAAHATGQAVATTHVPQHAFGAAYYALKAVIAADSAHAETNVAREWDWELECVPHNLRNEVLKRVIIQKKGNQITIKINKDNDF